MHSQRFSQALIELRKLEGRLIRTLLFYAVRCLRINARKVVFCVFDGNGYGDNPKYIAEEIIQQDLNYELVWLLKKEKMDKSNLPAQIRPVRIDSLRAIYELVTAGVWVDNHFKPVYVKKRKNQFYIQTSHGLPGLKRLVFEDFVELCKIEAKKIDVFISNGVWTSSVIVKDFWYHGEILESGNPRNDIFFNRNSSIYDRVRTQYKINPNQRIVLYAPTWRPHYDLSNYTFDIDMCLKSLRQRFHGDWILMVRHHPAVRDRSIGILGCAHVIEASEHEDMQELLAVVDVVVTDYSSLMFDFALRRLPIFLYTPDFEAFRKERGLYFTEDELPFSFARSNDELANIIADFDEGSYVEQVNAFLGDIGTCDRGNASQMVVNKISVHSVQRLSTGNSLQSITSSPTVKQSAER